MYKTRTYRQLRYTVQARVKKIKITMKCIIVAALALACVLGLVSANYYGYGGVGGGGDSGFLMLIGLLFLIMFLFNPQQTSASPSVTFLNVTR